MIRETTITTDQFFARLTESELRALLAAKLRVKQRRITSYRLRRRSADARRGGLKVHHLYQVVLDSSDEITTGNIPEWRHSDSKKRVLIIGSGPAGLFAALRLLEAGITPVIVERGPDVSQRRRDIAALSRNRQLNPESNYCFGAGGAGTFSDGKLFTRARKRGDVSKILNILVAHGADPDILVEAQPHIGTDRLGGIIEKMVATIIGCGGEVRFSTRCDGLVTTSEGRVNKAVISDGSVIQADAVILAAGHSARDVYQWTAAAGARLEAKTFAVGLRVEHPRSLIDTIQYNGLDPGDLGAAAYRLTAQCGERGVYTFCMCPGGVVVPSATGEDQLVVNGMSSSSRSSRWSNAAVVVELRPEDLPLLVPELFTGADCLVPGSAAAGLAVQEHLEQLAKRHGAGQRAPAQRLVDFLSGRKSGSLPESSYAPGLVASRLDQWLPGFLTSRLKEAFSAFDQSLSGFASESALLIGVETRTSSPVRILRDESTCEAVGAPGLFPAGEGAGYSGGIVSSAMDGERTASAVISHVFMEQQNTSW